MTAASVDEACLEPAQRIPHLTHDDLLTYATTRSITPTVVKAYLDVLIAASASSTSAPATADCASASPSAPFANVYAFDPLFWPRLCDPRGDVSDWRYEIAAASRHDVVLVPAPVMLPDGRRSLSGQQNTKRKHWLLLMVLRAEGVIECYDSLCDGDIADDVDDDHVIPDAKMTDADRNAATEGEDRCWRALETVRTALVERQLGRYWTSAATTDNPSSISSSSVSLTSDDGTHAGEWELRIMKCAQQQQPRQQQLAGEYCSDDDDDSGSDKSALYMLWHARCILLGAPPTTLTHAPPPLGFRAQMLRELGAALV